MRVLVLFGLILLLAECATPAPTPNPRPPVVNTVLVPQTIVVTRVPAPTERRTAVPTRTRGAPPPNSVENGNILLQFSAKLNTGLSISNICDEQANVDYVSPNCSAGKPTSLFEFSVDGSGKNKSYPSDTGLAVGEIHTNADGSLSITAAAKEVPLSFTIDVSAPAGEPAAIIRIKAKNTGHNQFYLRMVLPKLDGLQNISSPDMWGAVPQEVGSVGPLNDRQSFASQGLFGLKVDPHTGLPHAIDSMDLAAIYNHKDGGGLFFASLDNPAFGGVAPIQFNLDSSEVAGYWSAPIEAQQEVELPGLAIGVFSNGDWHAAADYYVGQNKPNWSFPQIPAWFRDEGAIYSFSGGGAGSIYLSLPVNGGRMTDLQTFENLPVFLTEAKALGSNIVYINNYWEGAATGGTSPYANKGDYIPRSDLGGAAAFKDGIDKIHQQGGRVILYMEPFIIYQYSKIGMQNGVQWEGHDPLGDFDRWYPGNYKMVASFVPWQDYISGVAQRLVRDYGADGIFLDSFSWQMNWQVRVGSGSQYYSLQAYNLGVLQLVQNVRSAIQAVKPDAVVLGETTAGPVAHVWDGGLSADFARQWGAYRGPITKIVASPVRYGIPQVNIYSNGLDLNELYQVYAAGHNMALCCYWPGTFMYDHAAQIRTLVEIRQKYKDALIYGQQAYQPQTGSIDIAAYFYAGTDNQIITVVNTSNQNYSRSITLRASEANTGWQDLVTGSVTIANGTSLPVSLLPEGILVLLKQS
jgi:hypothetical protein